MLLLACAMLERIACSMLHTAYSRAPCTVHRAPLHRALLHEPLITSSSSSVSESNRDLCLALHADVRSLRMTCCMHTSKGHQDTKGRGQAGDISIHLAPPQNATRHRMRQRGDGRGRAYIPQASSRDGPRPVLCLDVLRNDVIARQAMRRP